MFHDDDERMTIDFAPPPPLRLLGIIGSSDSIRMWGGYFFRKRKKRGWRAVWVVVVELGQTQCPNKKINYILLTNYY